MTSNTPPFRALELSRLFTKAQLASGLWLAVSLTTTTARADVATDAQRPASYAQRFTLQTPAASAAQYRIALPAAVFTSSLSPALADVRVFNAQGQVVPFAFAKGQPSLAPAAQAETVYLRPMRIFSPNSSASSAVPGTALRISESNGQRVIEIDAAAGTSTENTGNKAAKISSNARPTNAVLVDSRALDSTVDRVTVSLTMPSDQIVKLSVEASEDLKSWLPLGDSAVFKSGLEGKPISETISLARSNLKNKYLKLSWDAELKPDAINVQTLGLAPLNTASQVSPRVYTEITGLKPINSKEWAFTLPFAASVASLQISPKEVNALIPYEVVQQRTNGVKLALGNSVAYKLVSTTAQSSTTKTNPEIELRLDAQPSELRELRIVADKSSAGFASAPSVRVGFDAQSVVFVASGEPPFTLAVGLAQAPLAALPLSTLIPNYTSLSELLLPPATITTTVDSSVSQVQSADRPWVSTKSLILWGVLLAGVGLLGGMVWVLTRQKKPLNDAGNA